MGIPAQILVQGSEVVELIPQRAPMVMVDTLYECSPSGAVTGLTVRDDSMFCRDGLLLPPGIVEHMAQSVALMSGYEGRVNRRPAVTGYIGSVKNLKVHFLPATGERLTCTVRITHAVGNILAVQGTVRCCGKDVASCEMKVVEQPD